MQKIIIKNFGAVKYAEIEIKKVLVLIGEQASGKSTIAKLIYFFKSLRDDVFSQIYQDQEKDYFDPNFDIVSVLQEKFYNWFGSTKKFTDFQIIFYYNFEVNKYLDLTLDKDKLLQLKFSSNFYDDNFHNSIDAIKKLLQKGADITSIYDQLAHEQSKISYARILSRQLNDLFSYYQVDSLFVVAGRSAIVKYSEAFENHLISYVQTQLSTNRKLEFHSKKQTVDEILTWEFIKKATDTKEKSNKDYLSGWDSIYKKYKPQDKQLKKQINLDLVKNKILEILKGEYINENGEEKIVVDSQELIELRNASSGQQEVIRILQDIFLVIFQQSKVLRVVEEPETHLFPVAQKNLVELLALMVNQTDENQLIITTHSPYILTVFNNLLFAQRVVDKNPSIEAEVEKIISKQFWLDPNEFSAYSLGNHFIEEQADYCESIFDIEMGTIEQNYLDEVSEMLGGDFNALYSIHARTFRRK